MNWIYFENFDFLSSFLVKGEKYNGCIEVHTHSKYLSFKNIRGELPHIKVGPKKEAGKDQCGRPIWKSYCDWDCTIETMVMEGFPREEQDDVVEIRHGNQGGKGEIKNLIFKQMSLRTDGTITVCRWIRSP